MKHRDLSKRLALQPETLRLLSKHELHLQGVVAADGNTLPPTACLHCKRTG